MENICRPYTIHRATKDIPNIVDRLIQIENQCWKGLELSREKILLRLETNICWICVVDSVIVGVLYCQLIVSYDSILDLNTTFSVQENLHNPEGDILQLLGVAVLPQYSSLQIGEGLRDYVLKTTANTHIKSVIAMTRCSTPSITIDDYFKKVNSISDPTLVFHCVIGGASIVAIVKDYRPEDTLNYGYSIMIKYELTTNHINNTIQDNKTNKIIRNFIVNDEMYNPIINVSDVLELVGNMTSTTYSLESIYSNTSFMHFGLDSLSMLELRSTLNKKVQVIIMDFWIKNKLLESDSAGTILSIYILLL